MNVSLNLEQKNYEYYLVFTFEDSLNDINFLENFIENLIYIYFSNINQQSFTVDFPLISDNILKVHLSFCQSFSASFGSILFLNNQIFASNKA